MSALGAREMVYGRTMTRAFVAAVLVILGLVASPVVRQQSAYACSAGSGFNPVASSDVVVAGIVRSWEVVDAPGGPTMFQPVIVTIETERVLKGSVPGVLEARDMSSLIRAGQGAATESWAGGSGACGAFDFDPTGKYVVLGLSKAEDGTLHTHRLHTFFVGDRAELTASRYQSILDHLTGFGLIVPPATGSGGLAR